MPDRNRRNRRTRASIRGPQLPLADPDLGRDQLSLRSRLAKQPGRLEHQPVGRTLGQHLRRDPGHPAHRVGWRQ
jgi:hypothetical protein